MRVCGDIVEGILVASLVPKRLGTRLPGGMHSFIPRPSASPVLIAYSMKKIAIKNWRCRRPGNKVAIAQLFLYYTMLGILG